MRTYKRLNNRGFTLIELMIVVAIVGVLAALAIYGVRKYLLNAKTAEARNSVGQIAKDASTAYERESMAGTVLVAGTSALVSNTLCLSASGPVPAAVTSVAGKKYQSSQAAGADWNKDSAATNTGFACLKFSMNDPQYYMYNYTAANAALATGTFSASATGDLDGDAVTSSFTLAGGLANGAVHIAPNIVETNPEE